MENNKKQISDSLFLAIVLALSGGLMDAYSYLSRGKVFANAQTGNVLLLSVNLATGSFRTALNYLVPITAFAIGVAVASILKLRFKTKRNLHWRQIVVLIEAVLFIIVAFIPHSFNLIANSLISLACGAQVEAFKKVHGKTAIATTMCIGNLRSSVQSFCTYLSNKDKQYLITSLSAITIIISFALGAVSGYFLINIFYDKAIIISSAIMLCAFFAMLKRR